MGLLQIIERPADGMAMLDVSYFREVFSRQIWSRVKARKAGTCAASGLKYKPGALVYRPAVGNPVNRSQRILAKFIDQ